MLIVDFIRISEVIMKEIKLNSHCVNAKIQGQIKSDDKMKEIGYTKYLKGYLYFCRGIQ